MNLKIARLRSKAEISSGLNNLKRALGQWTQFVNDKKQERKNELVADFNWKHQTKKAFALAWRRYTIDASISPK